MSNSSLVNYVAISPNRTIPRNGKISKIVIHHMAGNLTVGKYLSSLTKPEIDFLYENCGFIQEEKEIFEMLRNKMTYIQISDKLGYSVKTINRRVCGIKEKIGKVRIYNENECSN